MFALERLDEWKSGQYLRDKDGNMTGVKVFELINYPLDSETYVWHKDKLLLQTSSMPKGYKYILDILADGEEAVVFVKEESEMAPRGKPLIFDEQKIIIKKDVN